MKAHAATWILLVLTALLVPPVHANVPSTALSYFVPQSGSIATPTEGAAAIANARHCPNKDGTQVLRMNARLKVVVKASDGSGISGIARDDVCILFNGGTPAQGFTGIGDDSIIANFQFNQLANCPDVRCIFADAPTDSDGVTYITWLGSTWSAPGVAQRNPSVKWGGYAGDIPVLVLGFLLQGRLTSTSAPGSYTAHVKSLDMVGGMTTAPDQGELVNSLDANLVQGAVAGPYKYNADFDNNGIVNAIDLNFIKAHLNHRCNSPIPD
jgi:hypothetical protein